MLSGCGSQCGVSRPELLPIPERLLEVVADQLVQLAGGAEPVGVGKVKVGARLLGKPEIGGVADQDVAKSEPVVAVRE